MNWFSKLVGVKRTVAPEIVTQEPTAPSHELERQARSVTPPKTERKWQFQGSDLVRRDAHEFGLIDSFWDNIVKLTPSVPLAASDTVEVRGTVACHQCGKPLAFSTCFTWGMLGGSTLSCPDCNVDISMGAYDKEVAEAKPLWVYARPLTENRPPAFTNWLLVTAIDGVEVPAGLAALIFVFTERIYLEEAADSTRSSLCPYGYNLVPLCQSEAKKDLVNAYSVSPKMKVAKVGTPDGQMQLHLVLRVHEGDYYQLSRLLDEIKSGHGTVKDIQAEAWLTATIKDMASKLGILGTEH